MIFCFLNIIYGVAVAAALKGSSGLMNASACYACSQSLQACYMVMLILIIIDGGDDDNNEFYECEQIYVYCMLLVSVCLLQQPYDIRA